MAHRKAGGGVTISTDEWQAELDRLARAVPPSDEGRTTAEIAAGLRWTIDRTRALLRRAKADGRLIVGTRWAENLIGRRVPVVVYRVKK